MIFVLFFKVLFLNTSVLRLIKDKIFSFVFVGFGFFRVRIYIFLEFVGWNFKIDGYMFFFFQEICLVICFLVFMVIKEGC